ncbi:MAG: putative ATP-dependent helicase [Ilumatobacteraceae bacterium]|nr:putative ATP-dependent helicase [Ilumatobacteraceae bacterium]
MAPTGSGKTLTAFLWGIDRLLTTPPPDPKAATRLLYISPLRALAVDVEKNLRAPLVGIAHAAERAGHPVHVPTVGSRTGDTPADERRRLARNPPDLLITTPESLYLMLTSAARETLVNVEAVIIDEIHALAATKRGSHLALTLERLEQRCAQPPQRIGLSATQRPLEEIATFLGGFEAPGKRRPVTVVDAGMRKPLHLEIIVPVEDMGALGTVIEGPVGGGPAAAGPVRRSIWPAMHPKLLELVQEHRSTLIFVNARRLAERLATRLNELAAEQAQQAAGTAPADGEAARFASSEAMGAPPVDVELVKAHHGSLSRERRLIIEDDLKAGRLRGLVATSSLELGIDMGAVDLVIQVESPGAVSRGLQRIGRAGHQVGEPSKGKMFPKHRADLVEAAVVAQRMHDGLIEHTRYPRNPLDVLAQQVVACVALDELKVSDLVALVRRAAPFAELSDEVWEAVLDLLAGRYPSEEFAELRPRVVWDRGADLIRGRSGAQRLAVTSGGTIPDRGLYGVFLPDGTRVGELDEEMVYESRPGETFLLGASTWRIEDITHERVIVTPAPGQPGKMPFWHGDGPGRPLELGAALGEFVREIRALPPAAAMERLQERNDLDPWAAENLLGYLADQADATGAVPDDRTIVVERFRDEIGDWRICVLSPFGAQVHAPWAMALRARLAERWGMEVELMWSDDGIVLRLPEAVDELPTDELLIDPDEIDEIIISMLPGTALFASRFREAAARALLLPRRRPDRRTPLWQQRQKAADLLAVAAKHPSFPILLEATRECCNDVFDLPALRGLLRDLRSRKVRVVAVDTPQASPMAQSLLFGWIAVYMYEGDAPLAERRAAALALDRDLLRELLGAEELRDLLDPEVLDKLELELQRRVEGRLARDGDEVTDLLRVLGPLTEAELVERSTDALADDLTAVLAQLAHDRRIIAVAVAGEDRWAASEDAGRLRDALGCAIPIGLPGVFTDSVDAPLEGLIVRYGRTHGPFLDRDAAARLGIDAARVRPVLDTLVADGRLVRGEFRPGGAEREWCDPEVLRQLRRRSLAVLRAEVEPVDGAALGRFLPAWQGVGLPRRGVDGLVEVLGVLAGASIPASVLEADVLPARMADYRPSDLDALCTAGDLVWLGASPLGSTDGRVRLVFRDQVDLLVPEPDPEDRPEGPVHDALRAHLAARGASFWAELVGAAAAAEADYDEATVLAALWDLVWAGEVTNDSLAPLRAFVASSSGRRSRASSAPRSRPRPGRLSRLGPPTGAGRWSLVASLRGPLPGQAAPATTEVVHARAMQLLERYGVLTREAALGEGIVGGFAGVYPVLKALEERGTIRRGYFVAGLGAAQFAVPGAVDRLRSAREPRRTDALDGADGRGGRDPADLVVLAATDPAQPYGASLPWPPTDGRPARSAGALVVLVDGEAAAYVEKGGRSLLTFPAAVVDGRWPEALAALVRTGQRRSLEIAKIDGGPARESPHADTLRAAGFGDGYKGLVLRSR